MSDKTKQVLLVENHRLFRDGLKRSLELDKTIKVVAEADDGLRAVEIVGQIEIDVVFMDINLSKLNGMDSTKQILKINPQIKIIGISMHKHISYIKGMMDAGASGYLMKTCSGKLMSEAVMAVLSGQKYFCSEILQLIQDSKVDVSTMFGNN
jgi:DNA-binding NarL/FixJ family response regulator